MKQFVTQFEVRGYELDSYGHVNNAVYLNYYDQARWKVFDELGMLGFITKNRLLLVVTDVHIRYMRESKLLDKLEVRTRVYKMPPYLLFKHRIINTLTGLSLSRAEIRTVFIDHDRKAQDIPEAVGVMFQEPDTL